MAIGDAYETAANYRTAIGKTDTGSDTQILTDLTAISRYLEDKLERFFNKDAADVTRIYEVPASQAELRIDDLSAAPTSITIDEDGDGSFTDETALTSSDYELLPLNAAVGPEARPYTRIGMTSWGDYGSWTKGQRVQIIGRWGWPAVPQAIKTATIQLTAILRTESPRATARIPELCDVIQASPEAQSIIRALTDNYRRFTYV
jgi:hypothetical protein